MSRSFRHSPVIIQAYTDRSLNKRAAAKVVRRANEVGDNADYRRHYPQWDLKENARWETGLPKASFYRADRSNYGADFYFIPVKNRTLIVRPKASL